MTRGVEWEGEFEELWKKEAKFPLSPDETHHRWARWGYLESRKRLEARIKELETALEITAGALEGSQGVVRELKEVNKHKLSECERLELELKKSTGELSKWLAPHEDSELQEMKQQSQQPSLAAKQAYINALEWTIKHREARVKELETALDITTGALEGSQGVVKELEETLDRTANHYAATLENWNFSLDRIKELEEGIEKVLDWRSIYNERIPFWKELYKLIEKEGSP